MKNKIDLIIFDCDGVVIDSEIISAQVLIRKLKQYDVNIDMDYVQQHFLGCNFPSVKQKIKDNLNRELPLTFEDDYRNTLLNEFDALLKPTEGFINMLEKISLPNCIATSSSALRTAKALSVVYLTEHFKENIFTAEEVSNGKPAPDLFLHAAKSMGVKPENCLVIEDSYFGVTAAIRANMNVIHYKGGKHISAGECRVSKEYPQVPVLTHWNDLFALNKNIAQSK